MISVRTSGSEKRLTGNQSCILIYISKVWTTLFKQKILNQKCFCTFTRYIEMGMPIFRRFCDTCAEIYSFRKNSVTNTEIVMFEEFRTGN